MYIDDNTVPSAHDNHNSKPAAKQGIFSQNLEDRHRRVLVDESGIDPAVIAARGYWTATKKEQLASLPAYQRRVPSLIMPIFSPDGETVSFQARPDKPRIRDDKPVKYDNPKGSKPILDVHPSMMKEVSHGVGELWITEGVKKADALVSRGFPTIGLAGVWMWNRPGAKPYELRPCWDHVALQGRKVNIVYDSDVMTKQEVHKALTALVAALGGRGAAVRVVYLPDASDGAKQGIDDWFVNGGTVDELVGMPRPFEPADYVQTRLSRDDKLRSAIEAVRREWEAMPVKRTRDCTDKAVMKDLLQALERGGELKDGELTVRRARTSTALVIKTEPRTVSKSWKRLEDNGYIARPNKPDAKGTLFNFPGGSTDGAESVALRTHVTFTAPSRNFLSPLSPHSAYTGSAMPHFESGTSQLPELRYSSLKVSRESGVKVYDYTARLAKKRGECAAYLVPYFEEGTELPTVNDLMEVFAGPNTDPRDFLRRFLGPMTGHRERGPLDHTEDDEPDPGDLLTGPPIIIIGDAHRVRDRTVTLADNYLEAIEQHREIGGEIEANRLQAQKIQKQCEAYRNRSKVRPDPAPTETEMDEHGALVHREMKDRVVGTFVGKRSGPRRNLEIYLAGNYKGAEFEGGFVNSVLQALGESWTNAKAWRVAVLEAAEDQRGESVPETGAPEPAGPIQEIPEKEGNIHTMSDTEAVELPRTDAAVSPKGNVPAVKEPAVDDGWKTHEISCECAECLSPMVSYAKPQPYRTDSAHPDNRGHQGLTSAA